MHKKLTSQNIQDTYLFTLTKWCLNNSYGLLVKRCLHIIKTFTVIVKSSNGFIVNMRKTLQNFMNSNDRNGVESNFVIDVYNTFLFFSFAFPCNSDGSHRSGRKCSRFLKISSLFESEALKQTYCSSQGHNQYCIYSITNMWTVSRNCTAIESEKEMSIHAYTR